MRKSETATLIAPNGHTKVFILFILNTEMCKKKSSLRTRAEVCGKGENVCHTLHVAKGIPAACADFVKVYIKS